MSRTAFAQHLARMRAQAEATPHEQVSAYTKPTPSATLRRARTTANPAPTEIERVCRLACYDYTGNDLTPLFALPGSTWNLRPIQSEGLLAARHTQGTIWFTGVGAGKTLKALLLGEALSLPAEAFPPIKKVRWNPATGLWERIGVERVPDCAPVHRMVYLTKTSLVDQVRRQTSQMRQQFRIRTEILTRSFDDLSSPRMEDVLPQWVGPSPETTIIVVDECHSLKNPTSSRTKRAARAHKAMPGLRWFMASGSAITKKVQDIATLSDWALGDRSPLPRQGRFLYALGEWTNHRGSCEHGLWPMVHPLVETFKDDTVEESNQARVRSALSRRLQSAPGVVISTASAVDIPLHITLIQGLEVPGDVQAAQDRLRSTQMRPDGEVMEDDLALARTLKQLAAGFWYRWKWGEDGPDYDWLDARAEWHRQLRVELKANSAEGYDSPLLVANRLRLLMQGQGCEEHAQPRPGCSKCIQPKGCGQLGLALREWDVERSRRPRAPDTETVWIDKYLIRDVVQRAEALGEPSIVWYQSRGMAEALAEAGVPTLFAGDPVPEGKPFTLAAGVRGHGTGIDGLQRWSSQFILEPPPSGDAWEQLLGRLHRPGTRAKCVKTWVYSHCEEMRRAWHSAMQNARMLQAVTMNRQKLCMAQVKRTRS